MSDLHDSTGDSSKAVDAFLDELSPTDPLGGAVSASTPSGVDADLTRGGEEVPGGQSTSGTTQQVKEKGQELAETAQTKANEVASSAQAKADQGMDAAASGLGQAADKLRSKGAEQGGTAATAAAKTADTLDAASHYLRDKDTDQLLTDLEDLIRRKPVETLLAAAGVGFVLSRLFR